ncbi:MAG: class I SAM-dependent methyltransferase [Streptosporangiales bacterium]|nr:class I SAM-dependent methyltransferase [Streptosporangiales bacterium]MBO0891000.1 class I SAM-dependent methyltransferase [Acidothermales bacterium]
MTIMRGAEQLVCRSGAWGRFAAGVVLPRALPGVRPEGEVLEIGCGGGAVAARLLTDHPEIGVTGVDIDPAMVGATARRLRPYGPRGRAVRADCTHLPFEPASFDTVVTFLTLHHVGGWEDALAEAVRVLRPGGLLAGYDALDTRAARWFHRALFTDFRLAGYTELERRLDALGLEQVVVRRQAAGVIATFHARLPS